MRGVRGLKSKEAALLGRCSEFAFPLVVGSPRVADRLAELWCREDLGSFRGSNIGPKRDLLKRVGIETRANLESTRSEPRAVNPSFRPVYADAEDHVLLAKNSLSFSSERPF
jgi:hypothetical protein